MRTNEQIQADYREAFITLINVELAEDEFDINRRLHNLLDESPITAVGDLHKFREIFQLWKKGICPGLPSKEFCGGVKQEYNKYCNNCEEVIELFLFNLPP